MSSATPWVCVRKYHAVVNFPKAGAESMRSLAFSWLLLFFIGVAHAQTPPSKFLASAQAAEDYIVNKTRTHRIVLVGEFHWMAENPELVARILPQLQEAGVHALGIEMLRAKDQERIDAMLTAADWDEQSAMAVMRTAKWPYREYFAILRAAWELNLSGRKFRILALGPPEDWRTTLVPKGQNYDTFMADVVTEYLSADPANRILVYAGLNHSFTRYHQPESPRGNRVEAFFDRAGNILWRRFGEEAFVIALHQPWRCRLSGKPSRCVAVQLDCQANKAVGFDILGSPFEQTLIPSAFEYAFGHPTLRLLDIVDGYVWTRPLVAHHSVALIPLSEFAPDAAALAYVADNSPFGDEKGYTPGELKDQWSEHASWLRSALKTLGWEDAQPGCDMPAAHPPKRSQPGS